MIEKHFEYGASLVECTRCHQIISGRWSKCNKCGVVITEEDTLSLINYNQ